MSATLAHDAVTCICETCTNARAVKFCAWVRATFTVKDLGAALRVEQAITEALTGEQPCSR